uniref:hypothetical protein n=1 Tax=Limnohabitans sp. TaxID=1907725 RepID=UPI004048E096
DEPQSVEEEGEEVVVDDRMELVLALNTWLKETVDSLKRDLEKAVRDITVLQGRTGRLEGQVAELEEEADFVPPPQEVEEEKKRKRLKGKHRIA